jgi:hypothetical protein
MKHFLLLAALGVTCMLSAAHAANFQIVFDEVGSDVVATGSGSLADLDGLTFLFSGNTVPLINPDPQTPNIRVGAAGSAQFYLGDFVLTGSLGPANLQSNASSGTGPIFGYTGTFLGLPFNYSLGTQITSTATWTNTTLAALGLTPGASANISWNSGLRSMVVSVVPEPSTYAMALAGLACVGYLVRRRKRT